MWRIKININRTNLILIGLIVLLIISAAFFALRYYSKHKAAPPERNFLTESMDSLSDDDKVKYQKQAAVLIAKKDFSLCDSIKDDLYKTVCANNIALKLAEETQDIGYCQKMDDKMIPREECERPIIFAKSLDKEDISACLETKNEGLQQQCQNQFYTQLSIKKQDTSVCDRAPQERKDYCFNNFQITTKNFYKNKDSFDCAVLRGDDVQVDCQNIKKESASESFKDNCRSIIKTDLFYPYCLMLR